MTQIVTRVAAGTSVRVSLSLCRSGLGIGTSVITSDGAIPVEFLEPGDRIVTYDAGMRQLSHVSVRTLAMSELVRIRPSVLEEGGFGRDIVVSARQKLLIRDWRAKVIFGKNAALVEARRLADGAYMTKMKSAAPMRIFQLHFEDAQHIVQLGQGVMATSAALRKKVQAEAENRIPLA